VVSTTEVKNDQEDRHLPGDVGANLQVRTTTVSRSLNGTGVPVRANHVAPQSAQSGWRCHGFMIAENATPPCTLGGPRRSYRTVTYHFQRSWPARAADDLPRPRHRGSISTPDRAWRPTAARTASPNSPAHRLRTILQRSYVRTNATWLATQRQHKKINQSRLAPPIAGNCRIRQRRATTLRPQHQLCDHHS
jgi:hypothetical protein